MNKITNAILITICSVAILTACLLLLFPKVGATPFSVFICILLTMAPQSYFYAITKFSKFGFTDGFWLGYIFDFLFLFIPLIISPYYFVLYYISIFKKGDI